MKSPNKLLFIFLMISSTCMVISSSNWLMTWMGLEINMLGFIPLMFMKDSTNESEAAVKYLIPQSFGSTIFIMASIMTMHLDLLQILMPLAMCLKLGVAPLHFWFPPVMASLHLLPATLLLTWQKLAPIFAINSFNQSLLINIMPIAMISAMWGGIGGLNQTDIRSLLTYSSITHSSWMLASVLSNFFVLTIYMLCYMMINFSIYLCLNKASTKSHKQVFSSKELSTFVAISILILSLGGLPPLTGFIMKMTVLYFTNTNILIIVFMIMGTLISLFYYLFLTFSTLLEFNKSTLLLMKSTPSLLLTTILSQILPLSLILFFL
uniref:NADH dehydrogenase subunit 2 n=1 Tax=Lamellidens marginalis TaxID=644998 RepID=UPI002001CAE7|nr:NADH dehydrogenase subunit 2 [Lamellidens marginalis]QTW91592.1 NADH dehydrogenase subunit 2 [Lamellidens marginalis]